MIGQKKLIENLSMPVDKIARFIIIEGLIGSGRKLIAKYIAKRLKAGFIVCGIKIDDVREAIITAYKQTEPFVFVFPDCDNMSIEAKNSLLKMTEEPARKAYIIMTVQSRSSLPYTLISRAYSVEMNKYTQDELIEYINLSKYEFNKKEQKAVLNLCEVPGQIDIIKNYNIEEFNKYCENIVDHIHLVTGVNALKIPLKLKYTETDEGWDIGIFLRAVVHWYVIRLSENYYNEEVKINLSKSIKITLICLRTLRTKGANKKMLIDMWVLDIRKVWVGYADN